ncbi:MAG: hypothetical protein AAF889_08715 [Cyanobacteria bacterium P01_D01_bin.73]
MNTCALSTPQFSTFPGDAKNLDGGKDSGTYTDTSSSDIVLGLAGDAVSAHY